MAGLKFDITGDNKNMLSALQGVQNGVRQTQKVVEQSGLGIEQVFGKIQTAATTAIGAFSAQQFASKVMEVRGQFQQLEVAFKTMLGSEDKANTLMNQLVRTAATTPFDLKGVADGAKQLLAYGIKANEVNDTLVRLGDIAAGLSIPLGDLVYLYGTTMVQGRMFTQDLRQFQGRGIPIADELAKQFGVAKDKVGELVTAGKVGSAQVKEAIESMTNSGGKFGGLMEAQSHTITGQISNIEDSIDMMYNDIGKQNEGFINTALSGVSLLIENYKTVGGVLATLITSYGVYKVALMSIVAIQNAQQKFKTTAELNILQEEIDKTNALLPAKHAIANADLHEAVIKKQLTQAQAELIAAKRAELSSAKGNAMLAPINEEIESIQSLIAGKKESQNMDLQEAVASGSLTQEMANEVAQRRELLLSLQEQLATKQRLLEQNVTNATSNLASAEKELDLAAESHQIAQEELSIAYRSKEASDARVQSALEYLDTQKLINEYEETQNADGYDELQAALAEQRAAAERLKTASENENSAALAVNSAQEQVNTAERELNTAQTELNAVSHTADTTATTVNTAATSGNTIATKSNTIAMTLSAIQAKASAAAQTVFSIAINGVKNSWNAMKIAMMTNPIGAIIGAVSMAIGLFMTFADTTDDTAESTKKYGESADKSASKVKGLYAILESDAIHTSKVQKDTMEELKNIADEYGITIDKEKDLYSQLIDKKEELIGLIKEESIERQKANDITAAGNAYQEKMESIKENIKKSLSNDFSDIQKNQLVTLIDDASVGNLQKKLHEMNEATKESVKLTGSWKSSISNPAIAAYNKAVSDLGDKVAIYAKAVTGSSAAGREAKAVVEAQAYALSHTREEYTNNINAVNSTANAARHATIVSSHMSESQMELANKTKLARLNIESLGSTIDELIKAYNETHINLKISYTELNTPPAWMVGVSKRMTSKQLSNLAASHQSRAQRMKNHKDLTGHSLVMKNKQGFYTNEREEQLMAVQYMKLALAKKKEEEKAKKVDRNKSITPKKVKSVSKKNNAIEKAADDRETVFKSQRKWDEQMEKDHLDSLEAIEEEIISKISDESQRERKERELQHKKNLRQIEEQADEMKRAIYEHNEEVWNRKNKNKKIKYFETKEGKDGWKAVSLTDDQQKEINALKGTENNNYTREKEKIDKEEQDKKEDALINYNKLYGTYEEKRLAIAKEYAKKISNAKIEGERKALEKQKQAELNNLDLDKLKDDINWEFVFGNLDNVDSSTAGAIKEQLEQFINLSKELTPDQIKTLTDALSNLQEKMDLSEPLNSIKEARAEFAAAKIEYDKYKADFNSSKAKGDTVGQEKATKGMSKSSQKMIKAKNKEKKSFKSLTKVVEGYAHALQEAGNVIGGATGECLKLAGGAILAGISMANGIKAFGEAVSSMEKSVAILAIIEAALKAIQIIMEIFGDKADATLSGYVETMDTYIKLLDSDISSLNDSMQKTNNTMKETIGYYNKMVELERSSADAVKSKSYTWLGSGASKGFLGMGSSSSEGVKIMKNIKASLNSSSDEVRTFYNKGYDALNDYFAKVFKRRAGSVSDFGRMEWLWDLSDKDLVTLSKNATAMALLGDKLSSDIKNYAERVQKMADLLNTEFTSLLDVSYDDFYDDFKDLISDMDNDSQTFAKNFAEYIRNALIKDMIASQYKSKLESLYKTAGKYAEEGVLDKHVEELREKYTKYANEAKEKARIIDSIAGYSETESQEASDNSVSSLTYEQANNIVALTTAGNISRDQIKDIVSTLVANISSLAEFSSSTNTTVLEIKNLMIYNNNHLEDILKYSKSIYVDFSTKIDELNKNLKELK